MATRNNLTNVRVYHNGLAARDRLTRSPGLVSRARRPDFLAKRGVVRKLLNSRSLRPNNQRQASDC